MNDLIRDAFIALRLCFTREMGLVLLKTAGLTLAGLAALGAILRAIPWPSPSTSWGWVDSILTFLGQFGLVVALILLALPVFGIVVGIFLEEVANKIERREHPDAPPPEPAPFGDQLLTGLRFARTIVLWNLLAVPVYLLLPGFNMVVYLALNGALIGREYFEMVALRRMRAAKMRELRRAHFGPIFAAGSLIAALLLVPGVNLVVPLFGTAFMVRLAWRFSPGTRLSGGIDGGLPDGDAEHRQR